MKKTKCGPTHHMACYCREEYFSLLERNLNRILKIAKASKDAYGVEVIQDHIKNLRKVSKKK
jgi:hypothetical protein